MRKDKIPSNTPFNELIDDIRKNGQITQTFHQKSQSAHIMIANECAHNLTFYLEYADIFTGDRSNSADLVQHAFEQALNTPDDFHECLEGEKDYKDIFLGYIQASIEKKSDRIMYVSKKILANLTETVTNTPEEKDYLIALQKEIANTLKSIPINDARTVIDYMKSPDEKTLPKQLINAFAENKTLKELYLCQKPTTAKHKPQI